MTGFGVDVAATRADDLDKKLLARLEGSPGARLLDVGCGAGGFAARLADYDVHYLGIDQHDFSSSFKYFGEHIAFSEADLRHVPEVLAGKHFDYCLMQRVIHYLPYNETSEVLSELTQHVDTLFISFSGLESDIGEHYPDRDKKIEARFTRLTPNAQSTFSITEPLCLYTPEEAAALLQQTGWEIAELWVSAFGNIKVICETTS